MENLKNKISDMILDFADNTADLPRGDKQGIAEIMAREIIEIFKKIIEKQAGENIKETKLALNNFYNEEKKWTDKRALFEIENLEIGEEWAIYWCGYFSALNDLKTKL